jgi:hypothetical protein
MMLLDKVDCDLVSILRMGIGDIEQYPSGVQLPRSDLLESTPVANHDPQSAVYGRNLGQLSGSVCMDADHRLR